MATISALTENFTGGAVGDTVNTTNSQFATAPPGGSALFIVDPFDSTLRMMEANVTANSMTRTMNMAATGEVWFVMDVAFPTATDTNTGILAGYVDAASTSTGKFFDVRYTTTGTLQLRDNASAVYSTPALTANVKHRVYVQCQCNVTAGNTNRWLRMLVYSGGDNLTLTYDSGVQTLTQANATISNLRMGILGGATAKVQFGRFRGDDANQPIATTGTVSLAASSTTPAANATVTLTATHTGTGTLAFQQTAGTTVTLSGTGDTRTFTAPAGQALTFTATYGGVTSSPVTVTAAAGSTVDAGPDQIVEGGATVTVTATTGGAGSLVWTITGGVTLTGTGNSRTFRAPAAKIQTDYVLTATYGGAIDTVQVRVLPHLTWYMTSGGVHKAYYPSRVT